MPDLDQLSARYQELRRFDAQAASDFYWAHLLGPIAARAREASAEASTRAGEVDLLVSMAGSSPMTTILAFEVLQPTEVVVLTSPDFKHEYRRIAGHIVGSGQREYDQVSLVTIDPTDPVQLYRTIRMEMERRGAQRAVIDITGGKKVMSATAAMSAWLMDLPLAYVEGQWRKELGGPVPGSEHLILLSNPVSLFGEVHLAKAEQLFDTGAWAGALPELERLARELPDPSRARFLRDLACLYMAWSDLDLEAVEEHLPTVRATLHAGTAPLRRGQADHLEAQLAHLEALVQGDATAMHLTTLLLARHYAAQGRRDFAVLLYYRTLEGLLTQRLAERFPLFTTRSPAYETWGVDLDELREKVADLWTSTTKAEWRGELPPWVGHGHAATLLTAVDDPLLGDNPVQRKKTLGHLLHLGELRNGSVLAHGHRPVSAEDARSFDEGARTLLRASFALHERGDLGAQLELLEFIKVGS